MSVASQRALLAVSCLLALALCASPASAQKPAPPASVTIVKPTARTVTGGGCRIMSDGLLSATFPPDNLPTLAFTIGPTATMAEQMHSNRAAYKGPGTYKDEILMVYLGKTALDQSYGGLGNVTINPDGHSGAFVTKDGKAAGKFDCGAVPKKPS